MLIGNIEIKRRVWICLGFAIAVTGGWWLWRGVVPRETLVEAKRVEPLVRLAKAGVNSDDNVLRQKAEYFDPTPLFFPTEWNYGQNALRENIKREPGQVFGSFEPKFAFGEQNLKTYNADTVALSGRLPDVVAAGNEVPFAGLGEIEVKPSVLPERSAFLEIRRLHDGKAMVAENLVNLTFTHPDFAPLEFLVVISPAGVVAEPVLTKGSGWDEVDGFLKNYLVNTFRVGARLAPGIYRVLIGP